MKLSCLPVSFYADLNAGTRTLGDWFRFAPEIGLDGADLSVMHVKQRTAAYLDDLRQQASDAGVQIVMMATYSDFTHPDSDERQRQISDIRSLIEVGSRLGLSFLRVTAGQNHPGVAEKTGLGWAREGLLACLPDAQAAGIDVVMPQHARRITDFSAGRLLGHKDHVVAWPRPKRPNWMSLETWQSYPSELPVRECEVDGRVLVTTLLDLRMASPRQLDDLYALRWNIEVDWRTIKVTMDMDVLRCLSPDMIRKEIAVYLLAYNLVRWTVATAAKLSDVLPRALSFTGAKRALLAFAEQLRHSSKQRLTFMFTTVLGVISYMQLPDRPDRVEPRAKKRRPKPLPLLTEPRQLAREKLIAQRAARMLNVAP